MWYLEEELPAAGPPLLSRLARPGPARAPKPPTDRHMTEIGSGLFIGLPKNPVMIDIVAINNSIVRHVNPAIGCLKHIATSGKKKRLY